MRTEDDATGTPMRRSFRSLARTTRAFLAPHLFGRTRNFASGLRVVRSLSRVSKVPLNCLMHQRDVWFDSKHVITQVNDAGTLTGSAE